MMKVRDIATASASEIWITLKEEPYEEYPEIKVICSERHGAEEFLSDKILDAEINMICAEDNIIKASLMWEE